MHRAAKVHRDLKPSNVLVDPGRNVVIVDFGLALDQGTDSGTADDIKGTPGYMAPEQAAGEVATAASDWYAFGVSLYEVLAGRRPFVGSPLDVMSAKQRVVPRAPSRFVRDVDPGLEELALELLALEPAQRPGGEEVLRRLGVHRAQPQTPPTGAAPPPALFVGRAQSLSLLRGCYRRTDSGQPACVALQGEPGLGKTTLAEALLSEVARDPGAVVLAGRCHPRENVPYKALDGVVDALGRYLSGLPALEAARITPRDSAALLRVFPSLASVDTLRQTPQWRAVPPDPQELRRRAYGALKEVLGLLSEGRRVVLFVDDLQWGDADSARLLRSLFQPPDPPAVLLLTAFREGASGPCVEAVAEAIAAFAEVSHHVNLDRLTEPEARRLARHALGGRALRHLSAVVEESQGNPHFIVSMAANLRGAGTVAPGRVTLAQVLLQQVAQVGPQARELLELLAVAGRPLHLTTLTSAAPQLRDGMSALSALRARRLVRTPGTGEAEAVEIYHSRLREALLGSLDGEALRVRHRQLVHALSAAPVFDADALTAHLIAAGLPAQARQYAVQAAQAASAALAFDRAADLYRIALDLPAGGADDGQQLRMALAEALVNAGRLADAAAAHDQAARLGRPQDTMHCRQRAAELWLASGRLERGVTALQQTLSLHGLELAEDLAEADARTALRIAQLQRRGLSFAPRRPPELDTLLLARVDTEWSVGLGLSAVDDQGRHRPFVVRHLIDALDLGDTYRVVRGLCLFVLTVQLDPTLQVEPADYLSRAEQFARQSDDPRAEAWVAMVRGWENLCRMRPGLALRDLEAAQATLRDRCRGVARELGLCRAMVCATLPLAGLPLLLGQLADQWCADARDRDDRFQATFTQIGRWWPLLAEDKPLQALQVLRSAVSDWQRDTFDPAIANAAMAEVLVALYSREPRAVDLAERVLERLQGSRFSAMPYYRMNALMCHGMAMLAHGGPVQLARAVSDAAGLRSLAGPWADALSLLVEAGVASHRTQWPRAQALLRAAAAGFEDDGADPVRAACVRARLAQLTGDLALWRRSTDWLRQAGIVQVERWLEVFAPGHYARGEPPAFSTSRSAELQEASARRPA